MSKLKFISIVFMMTVASNVWAGGILTNTNQRHVTVLSGLTVYTATPQV